MYHTLDASDLELIARAYDTLKRCYCDPKHTVGAAVLCGSGSMYTGVNIEACAYGPCAEPVALGAAFTNAEREIKTIVAVSYSGNVLSPCGNCRQLLFDYAPDAMVIFNNAGEFVKTEVRNLLPGSYSSELSQVE